MGSTLCFRIPPITPGEIASPNLGIADAVESAFPRSVELALGTVI